MSKKIYFASDFHLGIDGHITSAEREKKIVRWLDEFKDDMAELYLVGDVFDYWFEYKRVIPKGYIRLFGKLCELRDKGIPVYFFTGNHDMWMFTYIEQELGIPIYRGPIERVLMGRNFYIAHGDGLGPGDKCYKFIKRVFNNAWCQRAFSLIHPNIGIGMMKYFSGKSRQYTGDEDPFSDPSKEWLVQFAETHSINAGIDFYIFGHRHLPVNYTLSDGRTKYINLGEWMYACSYAVFDGENVELRFYDSDYDHIYGT